MALREWNWASLEMTGRQECELAALIKLAQMNISLHGSIYVCNTFFRSLPMPCWWSSCYSRSLFSRTRVFLVPSPSISNYFQSNQRAEKLGSDFEGFKISSLQSLRYVSISSSLSFFFCRLWFLILLAFLSREILRCQGLHRYQWSRWSLSLWRSWASNP